MANHPQVPITIMSAEQTLNHPDNDSNNIIKHTRNWVSQVIVKYNICPFARKEVENNSIGYKLVEHSQIDKALEEFLLECAHLSEQPEIETSLVIFPQGFDTFERYLDLLDFANELIIEQGYEGVFQLASFHPDYCFEGESHDDAANYTNRSPYPTIHIIREASIEAALANYPHPETIPQRNIDFTRKKGAEFFQHLLTQCMRPKS